MYDKEVKIDIKSYLSSGKEGEWMKDVKYKIDKTLSTPLYLQLYNAFKNDIVSGRILDNERLPSRRRLTEVLGLGKNTVDMAYQKLIDNGYAISQPRSGYFARRQSPINTDIFEPDFYDLRGISFTMSQNGIDLPSIPKNTLVKLYRDITYDKPELFEYGHKYGEKSLRKAVAHYLYEVHGISCSTNQIIIGAGSDYLLEQLSHIFGNSTIFGFENPCYARSYVPIKNSGKQITLIDVGINGFDIEDLYKSDIDVLYLSPDRQFPTGYRMTTEQQKEILKWANEKPERYIIEADFDLDFSDKGGLDPLFLKDTSEKVIFLNSFYRSIAPSIKTGFMVLPKKLKERFDERLPFYTTLKSRIEQQVVAQYIQSEKYQRHLEKLYNIYSSKLKCLKDKINSSSFSKYVTIYNPNGGTHIIISVENGMEEDELRISASKIGVKLVPLSVFLIRPNNKIPKNSFVMGYGQLSEAEIEQAITRLDIAWSNKK